LDHDTLRRTLDKLQDLGLDSEDPGSGADREFVDIQLRRGASRLLYRAFTPQTMTLSDVLAAARRIGTGVDLLAVGRQVHPRSAAALDRAGIQYADTAGNANLAFDDVYVRVAGRLAENNRIPSDSPNTSPSSNLFSNARAKVLFALISWPDLASGPLRAIAAAAGVSLGLAQGSLKLFSEADLLQTGRGGRRQVTERAIDMWVSAYGTGLGKSLALRSFTGDPDWTSLRTMRGPVWLSGESLAPGLRTHATMTLYVHEFDPELALANRWRTGSEPTIFLRRAFWTSPRPRVDHSPSSVLPAPPLIAYADMLQDGDARVAAAAHDFRKAHGGLRAR